jgi:hypothetical protein
LAVGINWCTLRAKLRERCAEIFSGGGADDSGDFGAVLEADERGPELHAEGPAEPPAGSGLANS